ncbi:MAG TPA: GAF domain-containing SpoIIE family protein phosphatase, partial [Yinghuangia sp.]|nr:GAF domain-containing SpoIIE family protein phosphatase [Yinghuangia sp.]
RALLAAVLAIGSDLELESVLRQIVESAASVADAEYAALGVIGSDGMLGRFITTGVDEDTIAKIGHYPEGHGILGLLIREPHPLRLHDLTEHPESYGFPPHHPPMTTFLGVPIQVRNAVFGNLYLTQKRGGGDFTSEDEEALTALARAAGVAVENADLYQRLRRATEDFQRRLLPELPHLPGLDLQARYVPADDAPRIGGDWYDLITLPDRVPCLMVGDVMGHGMEAAAVMSQISNILRVVAFDEQEPPSRILQRLDEILHSLHGGPMATVIVARLEPAPTGRMMVWASAGHPPPLVTTPDGAARHLEGEPGVPLGVDPREPHSDHTVHLPPGTTVVLHTDGLIEAKGQAIDEGMSHAATIAATHATAPLDRLCDALVAARADTRHDDIAILAVRIAG